MGGKLLRRRIDDDADRFQRHNTQQGLDTTRSEEDVSGGDLAHELDFGKRKWNASLPIIGKDEAKGRRLSRGFF